MRRLVERGEEEKMPIGKWKLNLRGRKPVQRICQPAAGLQAPESKTEINSFQSLSYFENLWRERSLLGKVFLMENGLRDLKTTLKVMKMVDLKIY